MPLETIYIARHGFRQGFNVPKSALKPVHNLLRALGLTDLCRHLPTHRYFIRLLDLTVWAKIGVTGTWRDPVLTALGQQQARELAGYFADNDIPIDLIYSSPY